MCSLTLAASTSQLPVCRAVVRICDRWLRRHQCSKRWGHKVHIRQSQQGVEMCFYPATDPEGLLLLCWTQVGWQNTLRPESLALCLGLSRHIGHVHVKPKHTFPETIKKILLSFVWSIILWKELLNWSNWRVFSVSRADPAKRGGTKWSSKSIHYSSWGTVIENVCGGGGGGVSQ